LRGVKRGGPIVAIAAAVVVWMAGAPIVAEAQAPQTDVLLLLDTSGSMGGALDSAVAQVEGITDRVSGELGDVAFGVAEVRDYPIDAFGNAGSDDLPYSVAQPITKDRAAVSVALSGLFAVGGGDNAEAYGRALRDADIGAGLGWRPGASRMTILVADDVPHDTDLNEGIPAELQALSSPFDTLADPGSDMAFGTADDIDWQPLLDRLAADGLPLMLVLFEGSDQYLPYWQIWAARTGGAAASADDANLADTVVELARRGAAAKLPPCPAGQSRDSARRCRPYSDWLGYSFRNGSMPDWARAAKLSRDDVLSKRLVERTFRDIDLPSWWEFLETDPRDGWWASMDGGTCFGMALSGGRFSTGLDPLQSSPDLRTAGSWAAARVPLLPGPSHVADPAYQRELLQTLATDFVAQDSTQVRASLHDQQKAFATRARAGQGAAALRSQLDAVMTTGRGQVDSRVLSAERPVGIGMVVLWGPRGGGHAIVAFGVRDQPGGGFHIDVWDNNQPGKVNWIPVAADGSWSYGPLGWSGTADDLAFLPEFRARGLNYQDGGKSASGRNVTIVDVPASASEVRAAGGTSKGDATDVSVQPRLSASTAREGRAVVTDGSRLSVSLSDRDAGATARGNGTLLVADGLTGGRRGKASIAYDTSDGSVSADGPRVGQLMAVRGDRAVASTGAQALAVSRSGTIFARAGRRRTVTLVLTSTAGRIGSAILSIPLARRGSVTIRWGQAQRAIRRGGGLPVTLREGRRKRVLRVKARSIARSYAMRARVGQRGRSVALRLSTRRGLPRDARARVVWRISRGKRTLLRRIVEVRRVKGGRPLGRVRLPKGARGAKARAEVQVVVKRPGPAELVAVAVRRLR
jgi:hypothetical protein